MLRTGTEVFIKVKQITGAVMYARYISYVDILAFVLLQRSPSNNAFKIVESYQYLQDPVLKLIGTGTFYKLRAGTETFL